MCGILYARLKSTALQIDHTREIFADALSLIKYRGPDATGITTYQNHLFGHVRLAIIDPSETGSQPVEDENGVLIFNGELYNYADLDTNATSDTRVLFDLFAREPERLSEIRGMYAAVYLDKIADQVHFIRDYYGEKPLYIFEDENIQIACSALKPIRHLLRELLGVSLTVSHAAIDDYLLFGYVREPLTIYANVMAFGANGHQVFSPNENKKTRKLLQEPPPVTSNYLERSVAATDVTPVLLLSSGVDSTYLLSRIQGAELKSEVAVYTHQNPKIDESNRALGNLKKIAPAATAYQVKNTFELAEIHRRHAALMEQPTVDGLDMLNVLTGLKEQRPETRLVLTGTGGDELYGGYNSFHRLKYRRWLKLLTRLTGGQIRALRRFGLSLKGEQDHPVAAYYFKYRLDENFLPFLTGPRLNERFQAFLSTGNPSLQTSELHELKKLEVADYLRNQLLRDTDNIAMYLGIEARNPLLSPEAMTLAPDFKVAMSTYVTTNYGVSFGPKQGFNYGEDQTEFLELCRKALPELLNQYPVFREMTEDFLKRKPVPFAAIKKVYMLLRWLSENDGLILN